MALVGFNNPPPVAIGEISMEESVKVGGGQDTVVSFKNTSKILPHEVLRDHSISSSTTKKHSEASEFKYASSKKQLYFDEREEEPDELLAEAIDGVEISCQSDSIRSDPRS